MRSSPGSVKITNATASACNNSRGVTLIERMSSAAPTAAIKITAAKTGNKGQAIAAAGADK